MQKLHSVINQDGFGHIADENNQYYQPNTKMQFPDTFEEFVNQYSFKDDKEIYTNGSGLIPTFRLKQWKEHKNNEKQQLISFLEDKIKEYDEKINAFYETYFDKNCPNLESKLEAFQEVLDFVNKGGKDEN